MSINRFESKKEIEIALHAFARLSPIHPKLHFIIAGGFDKRVKENVDTLEYLMVLATKYTLFPRILSKSTISIDSCARVVFIPSFSDNQRTFLLANCLAVLYTPSNEHFGIVPLEAMYAMAPVIACNNGGPTETILNGNTGYLVEPTEDAFQEALCKVMKMNDVERRLMGSNGKNRVIEKFSLETFTSRLCGIIDELVARKGERGSVCMHYVWIILLTLVVFKIVGL